MGTHAFDRYPQHCEAYLAIRDLPSPSFVGLDDRWNMPAVVHETDLGPEARFDAVDHYVMTLHMAGSSVERLDMAGAAKPATAGHLSLQAPGSGGTFRFSGHVRYAHLYFKQSLLCEVGDELGIGGRAEVSDFFARRFEGTNEEAATYLSRAMDDRDPPSPLEMDSRAYLLIDSLLRGVLCAEKSAPVKVARRDIRRAVSLIEDDLSAPLRLSDLARAAGLSVYHFARMFRAAVGETPAEYLMRRRAESARALIVETDKPLGTIAVEVGFSSQSHMNRHIRQRFEQTPTVLRQGGGQGKK